MSSLNQPASSAPATRVLAGIVVPDTPIVASAIEYARAHCEPYLFNHSMRSWLFSAAIAQLKGAPHDPEVLAVATLLHDIGLSEAFNGPLRFEVEGANAALAFARGQGMNENRAQTIWDVVALNSTPSIALHKEGDVSLCTLGIGLDWGGFGYDMLSATQLAAIVDAFPRLEMKRLFTRDMCRIVTTRPDTTYDNFARDFGERFVPGYTRPSVVDFLLNAPFKE